MYNSTSLPSSLFDLTETTHFSKITCSKTFYFVHLVFCYLMFLSGTICFITRLIPIMKPFHKYFGNIYIQSMLYSTASSILIHNTGLPIPVLYSFAFTIVGMTIAWVLIKIHQHLIHQKATKSIVNEITIGLTNKSIQTDYNKDNNINLDEIINNRKEIIGNELNPLQRIFSFKTFHGIFMFISWINITGRIFASDQSGNFQCYTYAIYKPNYLNSSINNDLISIDNLTLVPQFDPNYDRLPWANFETGWALTLSIGPFIFALLFATIWSVIFARIIVHAQLTK